MIQAALIYLTLDELVVVPYSKGKLTFEIHSYEVFLA
jgi:hypothetical protein